ncbi:hypothetical protein OH799_08920 [Nocardia sp. NBC_00881]|uniref:hypothetical protein n=1 Tax=Nocardia sp. NBC_00881 TaxID=2975995 RepID=UPI00386E26CC|nr:hypothetical protein OH799_08920 [Nocardia sp. NBC_00881]
MRATVGISAEQSVVRGVVLTISQQGVRPTVLRAVEQPTEESTAASVAAALGTITADVESDIRIDDVAVAYRTVDERRAIVSGLSSAPWRSSSLVSTKMALLALLDDMSGLDHYGTVLVLEIVNYCTSFLVVGRRRDKILASDSWSSGVVDTDSASVAIGRIWTTLDGVGVLPDAVVLCGSSAEAPEVVSALQRGLAAPVIQVPDFATAAARGAALVAAAPFRNVPVEAPSGRRRTGRVVLVGAAVAALLGGTGIAVVQLRADHPDNGEVRDPAGNPVSPPASEAAPGAPSPAAAVPTPMAEPPALPIEPTVPPAEWPVSTTWSAPTPEVRTGPVAPSGAQQPAAPTTMVGQTPTPETPPPTTTVGPIETPTPGSPLATTTIGPPNGGPAVPP